VCVQNVEVKREAEEDFSTMQVGGKSFGRLVPFVLKLCWNRTIQTTFVRSWTRANPRRLWLRRSDCLLVLFLCAENKYMYLCVCRRRKGDISDTCDVPKKKTCLT